MRLSDKLKEARATLLDRLEATSKLAADEGRELNATELNEWDAGMREARDLEQRIARQEQAEDLQRVGSAVPVSGGPRLIGEDGSIIRTYGVQEKLADLLPRRATGDGPVSIARCIRGLALGNWTGASDYEKRAMGEGVASGGQVTVPLGLSAEWLDAARSRSVAMLAGTRTIMMNSRR